MKSLKHLIHVFSVCCGHHCFYVLLVWFYYEGIESRILQGFSLLVRERPVSSFNQVMVKGGVGVSRRTDGHNREVQVINGMGGD